MLLLRSTLARSSSAGRSAGVRALCTIGGREGKLPINGVDLYYRANGDAGLPIVCMPGAMGARPARPADGRARVDKAPP